MNEGLVRAAAWPVTVLVACLCVLCALFLFRRPIAGRIPYILSIEASPKGLSLKFSEKLPWEGNDPFKILAVRPIFSSHIYNIWSAIADTTPVTYAVIDLGAGQEWLTSRVFLVVQMLRLYRRLEVIVFVESSRAPRSFVGWSDAVDVVRWLAVAYPYLEKAYFGAAEVIVEGRKRPADRHEDWWTEALSRFFGVIQTLKPPADLTGWVAVPEEALYEDQMESLGEPADATGAASTPAGVFYERASWMTVALLARILRDNLISRSVHFAGMSEEASKKSVLKERGKFVAVVRTDGAFDRLVDRGDLVEQMIRRDFNSV